MNENLPQLSSGEIGWSIDQRRAFIGNGAIAEGAPVIGNTELLTEFSDLLAINQVYTYEGNSGIAVIPGVDASSPISRNLQDKMDDIVSSADFGCLGDGITDDSAALNRTSARLVDETLDNTQKARRTIVFNAGLFLMTSDLWRILSYTGIVGAGIDKTIIRLTDATQAAVMRTADSRNQIAGAIGTNSATAPSLINVKGLTLETTVDTHIALLDSSTNCVFEDVKFKGTFTNKDGIGNSKTCVTIANDSSNTYQSGNIVFRNCHFTNQDIGVVIDDDVENVIFDACRFTNLHKAIVLGENTTGSIPSVNGPAGVKAIGCFFDNIDNQAFHVWNVDRHVSAYNMYRECGNNNDGASSPVTPVVEFEASGAFNQSIGDVFDRNDADDLIQARLEANGSPIIALTQQDIRLGNYIQTPTTTSSLTGSSATNVTTFSDTTENGVEIFYIMERGALVRFGTATIVQNATAQTITDTFDENNGDIEIALSLSNATGTTTLIATNANATATVMRYMIRKIVG